MFWNLHSLREGGNVGKRQALFKLEQRTWEIELRVAGKKAYKLNLSDLHAVCEANYARLMRLFPDYEVCNSRELVVGSARVRFEVVERCRYTTFFRLHQQQLDAPLLGHLLIEVRAYHD
jgi:uncharacterized protein YqiB (DUF1249 family)